MYESELYDILTKEVMIMYNIEKEDKAYKYLKLRLLIYNLDRKVEEIDNSLRIAEFLLSELNISKNFVYKEEEILMIKTIYNIVDNWSFRASLIDERDIWTKNLDSTLKMNNFIEKAYINIRRSSLTKAKKITSNNQDKILLAKHIGIEELNSIFNVEVKTPKLIKNIKNDENHNPYKRTIEEKLMSYINHININNGLNLINENKLEEYMIKNLNLIEKGLTFIEKQFSIKDGRIDILAKDKNNNYVIIELKMEEDKEIIWQCSHYPEALKEKLSCNKVRMITVCPSYKDYIYNTLKNLNVEMYKFDLQSNFKKIENIEIRRLL